MLERPASILDSTNRKNLRLLTLLRWVAVAGQVVAIAIASAWLHIPLPLRSMGGVLAFLIALNLVSLRLYRSGRPVTDSELLLELLLDVAALTIQLRLSGGAANPFVSLFLLQAVLAAVLLRPGSTWTIVAVASLAFIWLTFSDQQSNLALLMHGADENHYFYLHIYGTFICFLLAAILLVLLLSRINQNLRDRDVRLAELRQQSAEEEHIIRMGLLASGAAHELGTPMATISVILNDWAHTPQLLQADPEIGTDLQEMQVQLDRCKDIVSGILRSSGEERGEGAERASLITFIDDVVDDWDTIRGPATLDYTNAIQTDVEIASDGLLRQIFFNVLDNAYEASPDHIGVTVVQEGQSLRITVQDAGAGFAPEMLAELGKPYRSTKGQPGRGLGLFLVMNVLRKLGGQVSASNMPGGGARVELRLPIAALSIEPLHAG